MSIIYLDQWVFVELLRTQKHLLPQYPKYARIYADLVESSRKGNNQFPFSHAHIDESLRRTKLSSRKELLKLIFELSRFRTIRPWFQVVDLEVRNAILKTLGLRPVDLGGSVFGDELAHCFGSKARVRSERSDEEVPHEIENKLLSALKDPEMVSDALSADQDQDYVRGMLSQDEFIAHVLEELRKPEFRHPDKNVRRGISEVAFLTEIIAPRFTKILLEVASEFNLDLDISESAGRVFSTRESALAFVQLTPTAYVFHVLNDARDRNISRAIEPNDLWDLGTLAVAVPYCDVVVTEREWSNILNDRRIGELYKTKITHKIEDLADFIDQV